MKRLTAGVAAAVLVLAGLAALLQGSMPVVGAGEWAPGPILEQARDGAVAVTLADGRLLVIGGRGVVGPVATVDVVGTDGAVTAGPSLAVARAGHVAIGLDDGRVLVAGGRTVVDDGSGPVEVVTGSVEILDAGGNGWTAAGALAEARAGAVGVALPDGAALVAGGDGADGPLASYEVFDPVAGGFAGGGILSSARADASGDVLGDGRVVVVGGTDGAIVLATADVIDPVQGTVSQIVLSGPRAAASATTLIDGTVLVVGGTDGADDLATTEVLDPATGIATAGPALASARRGHRAWRLPHNNAVLLVGGTSAGAIVAAAEQVIPWQGVSTGAGAPSLARDGAAGGAVAQDGLFLVAGGATGDGVTASTEFYGFVTLKTDKDDYAPGQTVTMSGGGWQPGEEVTLLLQEAPHPEWHSDRTFTAVADGQGNIVNTEFVVEEHHLGVRFYLTATGGISGASAQLTFTDARQFTVAMDPTTAEAGVETAYSVTVTNTSSMASELMDCVRIAIPAGVTGVNTLSVVATDPGNVSRTWNVPSVSGGFIETTRSGGAANSINPTTGTVEVIFKATSTAGSKTWTVSADGQTNCSAQPFNIVGAQPVVEVTAADNTAPTTTITLNPAAPNGLNGWYTSDVLVTVAGADNAGGSGVAQTRCVLDPPAVPANFDALPPGPCAFSGGAVTTDGMHFVYAASIDTAGNKETPVKVASFKIDKTAPVSVVVNADRPPDHNGWYNAAFTATWTGSDATSGIASCTVTPYSGPDTATGLLSGSCTDNAGNVSPSVDFNFQYDATAPVAVSGAPDRAPDQGTWYNAPVDVVFTGTDATSGIASCTTETYGGPDGTGVTVHGTCTDEAGNTSAPVASSAFDYDATAPVAEVNADRAPDHNGWYNAGFTATWTGTDATSGIASCTETPYNGPDTAANVLSGSCTDNAGNVSASVDFNFKYDATAPVTVSGAPDRAPDHNGWYNATVNLAFTGTDPTSGIDTCTVVPYSGPDGTGLTVLGSCTDVAGNTSAEVASSSFKFDATAPLIAFLNQTPAANANGWNKTDVTLAWSCTDGTSGPVASPVTQLLTLEGTGQSATGTCHDQAGNSASSTDGNVNIDKTAPNVPTIATPPNGAIYSLNQAIASDYTCSDALSGIDTCVGPVPSGSNVDTSAVGAQLFKVDATDRAGNTASLTHTYNVNYVFTGFFNPVANGVFNVMNAGRAVPLLWELRDALGTAILDLNTVSSIVYYQIPCYAEPVVNPISGLADDAGASSLRITGEQYHFNWKTEKNFANKCLEIRVTLTDGSAPKTARFKFTK